MLKNTPCSPVNLLEKVRIGTSFDLEDARKIALMLVDPDSKGDWNNCNLSHWQKCCYVLFIGVILHVAYAESDKTLHGVAAYVENITDTNVAFEKMMQVEHDPDGKYGWKEERGKPVKVHPVIVQAAKDMYYKAEDSTSNLVILGNARSFVKPYLNPADQPEGCAS